MRAVPSINIRGVKVLALEEGPKRLATRAYKLTRAKTGFRGAIVLHVDFEPRTMRIHGVRISTKAKDGSDLDNLVTAIGDALTSFFAESDSIVKQIQAKDSV